MNKKAEKLVGVLRMHFPELRWRQFKYIDKGWDHDVIVLDDKYVFRFPKRKSYIELLKKEIALLQILEEKISLKIPKYIFIAEDYSCAGYEIVPGKELKPWIYRQLVKPENKRFIAQQIGEFLTQLHSIPLDIVEKYIGIEPPVKKEIRDLRKNALEILPAKLSKREMQVIEKFLNELWEMVKDTPKTLIHYDLSGEHILVDKENTRLTGIIDFSDRSIDDPALDFALLDRYGGYGKKFGKMVFNHYGLGNKTGILHRAEMYLKRLPLRNMVLALKGHDRIKDFEMEYRNFKRKFKLG